MFEIAILQRHIVSHRRNRCFTSFDLRLAEVLDLLAYLRLVAMALGSSPICWPSDLIPKLTRKGQWHAQGSSSFVSLRLTRTMIRWSLKQRASRRRSQCWASLRPAPDGGIQLTQIIRHRLGQWTTFKGPIESNCCVFLVLRSFLWCFAQKGGAWCVSYFLDTVLFVFSLCSVHFCSLSDSKSSQSFFVTLSLIWD